MVENYAGEKGIDCHFYETEENDNVTELVREAVTEGYSLIAASGGDGTVSKVGAALVGTEIPLAIIPTGTANVFAQDLGIPRNVRKSVELIFKEHSFRTVDMMRIRGKYYLLNMGVGLNALMIEDTDHKKKSALGTSAIHLHRETLVDDGLLDLCILQSRNLWDYIKIFISIFLNRVKRNPKIHHFPVERDVFIQTEKELKVQADGDLIGTTPVRIEVVPRILKIIIPAQ
jgi:diacylglycerol kinase family enzyme